MKLLAVGLGAALLLARPAVGQAPPPQDRTTDREQITAILARWENAWNTHDMSAFGTVFHEDGTWILWTGAVWVGRRAIQDGHAEVHRTVFRSSMQRERLEELTFVGPDAAVVRFCSTLTGDERAPGQLVRSRKFLVVTRRAGVWGVSWGQNTRLADSVPDSECFAELRKANVPRGAETPPTGPRMGDPYEATVHPLPGTPVKPNTLTIASLLTIILLPFHIGGDVVLGFDRGGSGLAFVVVPILLVVACGTLLLADRRSGHVIMFLGGLAALGMPLIHRDNGFTAAVAKSPGGLFFIWTLIALGVTGGLAMILSARGLWNLRSRKT